MAIQVPCWRAGHLPHVHLSFDDHAIGSISIMRGFFLKYRVKAVFYVDSFETLDEDDLDNLGALRADGHVIGCHGRNHIDALEYSKRYGIEASIDEEVLPSP